MRSMVKKFFAGGTRSLSVSCLRYQQGSIARNGPQMKFEDAKPYKSIPGPKPLPIPYFGNFWRFTKFGSYGNVSTGEWMSKLQDEYGDLVRLTGLGRSDIVIIYDPEFFEQMHRSESNWPVREANACVEYYQTRIRPDVYGKVKGLLMLQGKAWQEMRSTVNPTLMQPKRTKIYTKPLSLIADEFVQRMRKIRDNQLELPDNFANELNKWSLESIAFIALDTRLGCLADNLSPDSRAQRMIQSVSVMFESIYYLDVLPSLWKLYSTPRWKIFVEAMETITNYTYDTVNEKMKILEESRDAGNGEVKSVLQELLKSRNPQFACVTAMDMLMGGVDTTSNGTGTILSFLAMNPEKQEKLFNELKALLPNKDSHLTTEILNDMKYLKATIKEAFRMKPVFFGNTRCAARDIVISGYQIPKGTDLFTANQIACNNEKYFKYPERFIPERWLKSEAKSEISASNTNAFTFMPFGFGPRMCVGRRFAELEMEVVVAKIIRNFIVSYHYGEMKWEQKLLTKPSKPLKFKIKDRSN